NSENEIQVIDDQWRSLPLESFSSVITEEKENDKFCSKLYNYKNNEIVPFKELAKFFLSVLSLPYSNADCERMFSKINRTKT
ncbi:Zinc finger protein, partial [Aphis craccivora]